MILKRNYSKKLFISSLLILFSTFLFCATAKYQDENFSLIVNYTETVTPGDAIFVRLNIQPTGELKKHKSEIATNSLLQLIKDKKEKYGAYAERALNSLKSELLRVGYENNC